MTRVWPAAWRFARPLLQWLAFAAIYYAVARASLALAFEHSNASPVWPPSGLALGGLLVFTRHERHEALAWRFAAAVATGALLANIATFSQNGAAAPLVIALVSLSIAVGNVLEAMAGASLFRRLRRGEPTDTPADFYVFCSVALVAAAVSASIGVAALLSFGVLPDALGGTVWFTWWLGDVTGMLVFAPVLCRLPAARHWRPRPGFWPSALAIGAGLGLSAMLVFLSAGNGEHHDRLLACALIVLVVLAAYRHGRGGAAAAVLAVAAAALVGTLQGHGPFAKATTNDSLISLSAFLALCAAAGWVVAAALGERTGDAPRRETAGGRRLPVAVLSLGLVCTLLAWHAVSTNTERQSSARFEALAADLQARIEERLGNYELTLRGARGLTLSTSTIYTSDWENYVATLDPRHALPGLQGIGYAARIPGVGATARDEGVVRFLAPADGPNQRVLGFDLMSEPVRREALERARDTGLTSITAPIHLIQDAGREPQSGFLMVLPVYVRGLDPLSVGARREAARGWVYAPFRLRALMDELLHPGEAALATLDVYDGGPAAAHAGGAAPMYASDEARRDARVHYPHQQAWTSTLVVGGRPWTLDLGATPAFEAQVDTQKAQLVLIAGTLISLLLFSVVRTLAVVKEDALALAERMAREREQAEVRFRSLAQSAADGIAVWSDDGDISFCNAAFAAMCGRDVEALQGMPIRELLPLPDARTYADWQAAMDAGGERSREHELLDAQDERVPVEVSLGSWSLHGMTDHVGIVRDVTRRRAADELLRETQDNLNTVLDNMPAMVSSWTRDLRVRFMNKEHISWYGIDPALHPNLHLRGVIGDAAFVELQPLIRRALAGERVSFERVIVSPDGRERWAQLHYIPDWRHGVVDGMIRLVFDITPLKTAQAALQANLQIHDAIFNEAGVGIALVRDEVFDRASRHLTELFGYAAGGLDGQRLSVICRDEASYVDLEADARAEMRAGHTFDREVSLQHRDGTPIWCRLVARAVDPDDPHRGSIVIVQDFRDRRQREVLLERARRAAESASRLKAEFLANMSHEIRTPMNGIIGMTRLTLESALTEAQRENLEIVLDSASSLLHLLNDILDFSKVEAGKLELERAEFDLRDRLWAAATPFATLARGKGIELVLDVAPDVPERLTGDSVRLMQVVTNLMSNAVKFTAAGSVTCRVDATLRDDGGCTLEVAVVDTGPGMPPEVQSRIFGSFVQADTSITREHGGTGLGLAICTQIVHLMQGTIRVESTPGEGSTFRFDARFEAASPPPEVPASQRERLAGASVLVVAALPALRASIARTLAAAGARAVEYAELAPAAAAAQLAQRVGAPFAGAIVDDSVAGGAGPELPHAVRLRAADRPLDGPADTGLRKPARPADLLAAVCGQAPGGRTDAMPAPTPARATRPLSILLAEDHPVNQKLAQRLLERRGHRVTWARHGEEAVRLSADAAYDVILMDIQMPVMDGITAMRAIRAREATRSRRTPIVALTAHAMQGERERLLALGMDDYLSKPLDAAALIRVVEAFGARGGEPAAASDEFDATLAEIGAAAAAEAAAEAIADEGLAPVDLPVIDRARALEGTQGDAGLLAELAALLREELPAAGAQVRAHVAAADWGGAARAAHRLKGAAGNLQALATQAAAARLESACAAADEAYAKAAVESLEAELARLSAALDSMLAETA